MIPMTVSIWAFNQFLDGGLFKEAEFPVGIDKDLVIDTIMFRNGELQPLYSSADFMQKAVSIWAKKWYHSFERWNIALTEDYNPVHNYDRYEDINERSSNTVNDNTSNNSTSTNERSSFDSDSYEPHDKNILDGSAESNSDSNGTFERSAHLYGNIGVTTAAQMIEGEITIRKHTIYDMIADCFESELCILVY